MEFNFPSVLFVFFSRLVKNGTMMAAEVSVPPAKRNCDVVLLEAGGVIQTDYRKQLTGIMGKRRQRQR